MTDTEEKSLALLARLTTLTQDGVLHWQADPMRDCVFRTTFNDRTAVIYDLSGTGVAFLLLGRNRSPVLSLSTVWSNCTYAREALRLLLRAAQDEAQDTAGSLDEALAALDEL